MMNNGTWACETIFGGIAEARKEVSESLKSALNGISTHSLSQRSGLPEKAVLRTLDGFAESMKEFSAVTLAMGVCINDLVPLPDLSDEKRAFLSDKIDVANRPVWRAGEGETPDDLGPFLVLRVLSELASTRPEEKE